MHGEVTDEYTTLIQVFRAVHPVCGCVGVYVGRWEGEGWYMAAHFYHSLLNGMR